MPLVFELLNEWVCTAVHTVHALIYATDLFTFNYLKIKW